MLSARSDGNSNNPSKVTESEIKFDHVPIGWRMTSNARREQRMMLENPLEPPREALLALGDAFLFSECSAVGFLRDASKPDLLRES